MMDPKKLRGSAFACLTFTILWLILMILSVSRTEPVETLEQAIASVTDGGMLFWLSYINAIFVTVTATVFFTYLYYYCRPLNGQLTLAGLVFVPVYSVLNLIVYFSQIAIVPRLGALVESPGHAETYRVMLGQFVQAWPGSAVSVINQLAYAVLGIPSIILGMLLVKDKRAGVLAGWLLMLNGLACIIGAVGTVAGSQSLAMGSVAGGALFLFALASIMLIRKG